MFDEDYYAEKMQARFGHNDLAKLKVDELNGLIAAWEAKCNADPESGFWDELVLTTLCDASLTPAERELLRALGAS